MKTGLIQLHSTPKDIEKNVQNGICLFQQAVKKGADLVVFPELWTCGYYLETPDFLAAADANVQILEKFSKLAEETHTVIVLPLPQEKENKLYIGAYVIESNGKIIAEYQKSFLWGREQNYFTPGRRDYTPIETSLGKLGLLICYDIEFPEPSRILAMRGAQIILVPSMWSIPAMNRWKIQLPARALDNTVFVLGINQVQENAGGCSAVISPAGKILAEASSEEEAVLICDIDLNEIDQVRKEIPYLKEYDLSLFPGGRRFPL